MVGNDVRLCVIDLLVSVSNEAVVDTVAKDRQEVIILNDFLEIHRYRVGHLSAIYLLIKRTVNNVLAVKLQTVSVLGHPALVCCNLTDNKRYDVNRTHVVILYKEYIYTLFAAVETVVHRHATVVIPCLSCSVLDILGNIIALI